MSKQTEFAVTGHYRQGLTVLEVDTTKAKYRGLSWNDLGGFGKRKFDNLLALQNPRVETKIIYL